MNMCNNCGAEDYSGNSGYTADGFCSRQCAEQYEEYLYQQEEMQREALVQDALNQQEQEAYDRWQYDQQFQR